MKSSCVLALLLTVGCFPSDETGMPMDSDDHSMNMDTGAELDVSGCSFAELRTEALASGTVVLAGLSLDDATPMADILADPGAYEGSQLQVQGMVATVCTGNGCNVVLVDHEGGLIKLQTDEGAPGAPDLRDYTEVGHFGIGEGEFTNADDPLAIALEGAVFLATDCAQ
jgi:hypothetical protein